MTTAMAGLCFKDLRFLEQTLQLECMSSCQITDLSLKEAKLLRYFMENPTVCLSKPQILAQVWHGTKVSLRTIDSQICRLRQKLKHSAAAIVSVYGDGYRLE